MAGVAGELFALVQRTVEGLGYELVDVERAAGGLMRVTLDVGPTGQTAPAGVTIDDCERVSHQLTYLFAVENVDYERLEVSSPGLDRPLRSARDFRRFEGSEVQVQLRAPLGGRKRWRGTVAAVRGDSGAEQVTLEVTPEADAAEPVRRVRPMPGKRKAGGRSAATPAIEAQRIEFAVADVDKARLVPVLDFRSKQ